MDQESEDESSSKTKCLPRAIDLVVQPRKTSVVLTGPNTGMSPEASSHPCIKPLHNEAPLMRYVCVAFVLVSLRAFMFLSPHLCNGDFSPVSDSEAEDMVTSVL